MLREGGEDDYYFYVNKQRKSQLPIKIQSRRSANLEELPLLLFFGLLAASSQKTHSSPTRGGKLHYSGVTRDFVRKTLLSDVYVSLSIRVYLRNGDLSSTPLGGPATCLQLALRLHMHPFSWGVPFSVCPLALQEYATQLPLHDSHVARDVGFDLPRDPVMPCLSR